MLSTSFTCAACGCIASIVTLVEPGQPDPRITPNSGGVAPTPNTHIAEIFPDRAFLSIGGGPVSVTLGPIPIDRAVSALQSGDPAALFAIDREYAPFWCPTCRASYCGEHYRNWTLYDDGFFDCVRGECPAGHERILMD